jgi:hypothetical protein
MGMTRMRIQEPAKVLSVVALFSPDWVELLVSDCTHEQLQEQLQVFPPLIELAVFTVISLMRFSFFMSGFQVQGLLVYGPFQPLATGCL